MKRLGIAVISFLFGLFLTWLCLYTMQFIEWHPLRHIAWVHSSNSYCMDLEHCSNAPWWLYVVVVVMFLGPAITFAGVNAYAWKRWDFARWCKREIGLIVLVVAAYFLSNVF